MLLFRWTAFAVLIGLAGCGKPQSPEGIVLVVADGTSLELLTATRAYAAGASGGLAMDGLSHSALVRTYSRSHAVTDSAAAATAMARGIKADNQVVGMEQAQDQKGPPSILDLAKKAGWSTGVISDDAVTGATPAAFLVEHPRRSQYAAIAGKIAEQLGPRADLVLGGGAKWFSGMELRERGVQVFDSWDAFKAREKTGNAPILGLFYPEVFPYYADGGRTLRLKDMVAEAVQIFQERKKPFLLVVEAGLPDKASHMNNAKRAMVEVQECDAVIQWVRENLGGKVLLLVTTDHNTGGLAFNGYPPIGYKGDALLQPDPVTGRSFLTWASGPGGNANPEMPQKQPTDFDFVQPALVPLKSALHTGGDVWLLADGPGAERVRGSMNNTDIYQVMAKALPKP